MPSGPVSTVIIRASVRYDVGDGSTAHTTRPSTTTPTTDQVTTRRRVQRMVGSRRRRRRESGTDMRSTVRPRVPDLRTGEPGRIRRPGPAGLRGAGYADDRARRIGDIDGDP